MPCFGDLLAEVSLSSSVAVACIVMCERCGDFGFLRLILMRA